MKFEVVEQDGAWVVLCDGVELGRHSDQPSALTDVSRRLREIAPGDAAVSLAMRYRPRG